VVEFTDNTTLATTGEIVLPPKRVETVPNLFNIAYSADGHFLYAAYVTPARLIRRPRSGAADGAREIDTAGCVLVIPSGPNRVSSLCESGRLLTVTLDAQGHEASRRTVGAVLRRRWRSGVRAGIPTTRGYAFLSFLGEVHESTCQAHNPPLRRPGRW